MLWHQGFAAPPPTVRQHGVAARSQLPFIQPVTRPSYLASDRRLFTELGDWVHQHGGHVSKELLLVEKAPCGVRGIVAGQAGVSLADLDRGPLISLPYALYFDAKNAQALVAVALAAASRNGALAHEDAMHTVLSSLSAVQTLGLALALERQRGVASAWHTYICSLPPQPPCPWLLPEQGGDAVATAVADALHGDTSLSTVAQAAAAAAAVAAVVAASDTPEQQLQAPDAQGALAASLPQAAAAAAAAAASAAAEGGGMASLRLKVRADVALAKDTPAMGAAPAVAAEAAAAAVVATDGVHAAAAAALALVHASEQGDSTGAAPPVASAAAPAAGPVAATSAPPQPPPLTTRAAAAPPPQPPSDAHLPAPFPAPLPPAVPPRPPRQQAQLQQHSSHPQQAAWEAAVYAARAQHVASCQEVLDVCGMQLGVDMAGMQWGLGQVISRALTSGDACGLLPVIDLLNHHPDARPPMLQLDDNDQLVMTVTSLCNNEVVPLEPGHELYINYTGGGAITPLESFLKFGYVPNEAWGLGYDEPQDLGR